VVNFEQTHAMRLPEISQTTLGGAHREKPMSDKHKEYAHYAEHCLRMVPLTPDQEYRTVQREMASEWLRLAEAVLHPI
jgi:hypothetical protein